MRICEGKRYTGLGMEKRHNINLNIKAILVNATPSISMGGTPSHDRPREPSPPPSDHD